MFHQDLIDASHFLLECPPFDEIGGSIVQVIESYRYKMITREQAVQQMLSEHYPYISKYVDESRLLSF